MVTEAGFDAACLARVLGHDFSRTELLREAMTHPSINPQDRGGAQFGYERLEFLGDRVLGLVIAEWLLERFPAEAEGSLAMRHTALVRREALAEVAGRIGLGRFLMLSAGEEEAGGRDNETILADACEAVIAALYLDGGLTPTQRFIRAAFAGSIERHERPPQDAKTALQEWAQARGLPLPRYQTVSRSGPDHAPLFEISVEVAGRPAVSASGSSKRAAEQQAAVRLLDALEAGAAADLA
ncbi:MAG: ribonuclease III [Alphaproteobacteria bacterium]